MRRIHCCTLFWVRCYWISILLHIIADTIRCLCHVPAAALHFIHLSHVDFILLSVLYGHTCLPEGPEVKPQISLACACLFAICANETRLLLYPSTPVTMYGCLWCCHQIPLKLGSSTMEASWESVMCNVKQRLVLLRNTKWAEDGRGPRNLPLLFHSLSSARDHWRRRESERERWVFKLSLKE